VTSNDNNVILGTYDTIVAIPLSSPPSTIPEPWALAMACQSGAIALAYAWSRRRRTDRR
jgi:hypothetical protein